METVMAKSSVKGGDAKPLLRESTGTKGLNIVFGYADTTQEW